MVDIMVQQVDKTWCVRAFVNGCNQSGDIYGATKGLSDPQ